MFKYFLICTTFFDKLFFYCCRETKIVTKGDNVAQLMTLAEKASSLGLPHYIVHDAGKTQVRDNTIRIFNGV